MLRTVTTATTGPLACTQGPHGPPIAALPSDREVDPHVTTPPMEVPRMGLICSPSLGPCRAQEEWRLTSTVVVRTRGSRPCPLSLAASITITRYPLDLCRLAEVVTCITCREAFLCLLERKTRGRGTGGETMVAGDTPGPIAEGQALSRFRRWCMRLAW